MLIQRLRPWQDCGADRCSVLAPGLDLLRNERDLADPARSQPLAPEPVGGQQLLQRPAVRSARRCPRHRRQTRRSANPPWRGGTDCSRPASGRPARPAPGQLSISSSGVSHTVSASGMPRSLGVGERQALFDGEGEPSAGRQRPAISPEAARPCPRKASIVSSRSTTSNGPGGMRGDPRDLEATGKVARALPGDVDGAGAVVHPQIGAAQLPGDEPSRPGDSAAEVEHRDPGCDAGPARQGPNLAGAHEALLLDELAGGIRRHAGSLEGPDERRALVLPHGCPTADTEPSPRRSAGAAGTSRSRRAGCHPRPGRLARRASCGMSQSTRAGRGCSLQPANATRPRLRRTAPPATPS